jgi:hypothetical protein
VPNTKDKSVQNTKHHKADAPHQRPFTATEDASILRGVETYASSSNTYDRIRDRMLDPDTTTVSDIQSRFCSLKNILLHHGENGCQGNTERAFSFDGSKWDIPGKGGSWLAPVPQGAGKNPPSKGSISSTTETTEKKSETANGSIVTTQSRSGRKIQRKTYMDCIHYS